MSTEYPAPVYAFPGVHADELGYTPSKGMTLRDYFAAKAIPKVMERYADGHPDGWHGIARQAYAMADAMLEARK